MTNVCYQKLAPYFMHSSYLLVCMALVFFVESEFFIQKSSVQYQVKNTTSSRFMVASYQNMYGHVDENDGVDQNVDTYIFTMS
jgi:hypothetical protein